MAQIHKDTGTVPFPPLFSDLTLEISAPAQSLLSLQPIPLTIKQYNRKSHTVLGYSAIGFGKSPLSLSVKKIGGKSALPMGIRLTPINKLSSFTNVEIEPGEGSEANEWISIGLHRYFPEPGRYELKATLANENGTQFIESNILIIEIREPTGSDRSAYNLIKDSSFQDYLFSGVKFDSVRTTLETLRTRYPNSPYARSALFVMGERYFVRRQFAQALINLIRLENDNNFIFAEKVKKYLDEIREMNSNREAEGEKPSP